MNESMITKLKNRLKKSPWCGILVQVYFFLERLKYLPGYLVCKVRNELKIIPNHWNKVFFTLDDDGLFRDKDGSGRYAYLIVNRFCEEGYYGYLYKKLDFRTYIDLGKYGRYLLSVKNLKFVSNLPFNTEEYVYAFDMIYPKTLTHRWQKLTFVNVLKTPATCQVGDVIPIPYFMHPRLTRSGQHKRVSEFRNTPRTMKILFAGNAFHPLYDGPRLALYNALTRDQSIKVLMNSTLNVHCHRDARKFQDLISSKKYHNECHIVVTESSFPINPVEWLSIIAKSDFFLCFSGTDLPMCHNAIESLSVGAIPIISYADWFFPQLEHKKNAIIYSGPEDLINKVKEVLAMEEAEIKQMRRNAFEYFDSHLTSANFIKRYKSSKSKVNTIMLHPRFIPGYIEPAAESGLVHELEAYFKEWKKEKPTFVI